jgi:hypothetical protein
LNIVTRLRKPLMAAKRSPTFGAYYDRAKDWYLQFGNRGQSKLDILATFPLFRAYSGGTYAQRAPLSIQAINDMVPALVSFSQGLGRRPATVMTDSEYAKVFGDGRPEDLAAAFTRYGSDKATHHSYHLVYASVLGRCGESRPLNLFEIGLGTNMVDVVSNMGIAGHPGASLRAFRDFLPNASIYGADVDRRVLFEEERIKTFHVDQTDRDTFVELGKNLPDEFDVMIDDGLHLPTANINSLSFFLSRLRDGGFAIIEDIPSTAEDFWQLVARMLPDSFKPCIVRSGPSLLFVVQRTLESGR